MARPWCVLHKKCFSNQQKQYTVDENNYYWLKVSFEKIGSVVCQKCYDKKRHAQLKGQKKVPNNSFAHTRQKPTTDPFSSH